MHWPRHRTVRTTALVKPVLGCSWTINSSIRKEMFYLTMHSAHFVSPIHTNTHKHTKKENQKKSHNQAQKTQDKKPATHVLYYIKRMFNYKWTNHTFPIKTDFEKIVNDITNIYAYTDHNFYTNIMGVLISEVFDLSTDSTHVTMFILHRFG